MSEDYIDFLNNLKQQPWVIDANPQYLHHWRTASWRTGGGSKPEDFYRSETCSFWDKMDLNKDVSQGLQMVILRA